MIKQYRAIPTVILLLGLTAIGADAAQSITPPVPRRGGILRLDNPTDIRSVDPVSIYDWLEGIVACMVHRSLLDFDQNERIIPMLAEDLPKITPDGLTYTFKLRHGVLFSNGREVTADDCAYSLERQLDPRNNSTYSPYYINIVGAKAFKDARSKELSADAPSRSVEPRTVTGLAALDRYTLQIRLEQPNLVFSDILATPFSAIVPRDEVDRLGAEFATHPVGAGPFILSKWSRGIGIRLDRNPRYFRLGEPYLDHVDIAIGGNGATELMMFERGELDYVLGVPTPDFLRLNRTPQLRRCMFCVEGGEVLYVSLNCEIPPFTDVRVRRAINYAVNKAQILKVVLNRGVIAHGLLVPFVKGFDEQGAAYPFDPTKARALLAEAGYPNGFETQFLIDASSDNGVKIALVVQRDLGAVGIKVEIRKVEGAAVYMGMKRKTVPMEFWTWVPNINDPKDTLDFLVNGERITDDNCINSSFYTNPQVNQLFHQGSTELDPVKRLQVYQQIEKKAFDDAAYLYLIHLNEYELHQPWLKGVAARGIWPHRLENAWIDR